MSLVKRFANVGMAVRLNYERLVRCQDDALRHYLQEPPAQALIRKLSHVAAD